MAPLQQSCFNKDNGPYNWKRPNDNNITTTTEAHSLAQLHFVVCNTKPDGIQKKWKSQEQAEHKRLLEEEAA